MRRLSVRRQDLPTTVAALAATLDGPLYRGVARSALEEYCRAHTQTPRDGDLSVGEGVCFTTDLDYALTFCDGLLLVTDQARLARGRRVVDTAKPGYDTAARARLDKRLGPGNYDGYRLWAEIQEDDTILATAGKGRTYVARREITTDDLAYEVALEGEL
jgi:hypothetical protein